MGAVDLHAVETGLFRADGGNDEVLDQRFHLAGGQRPRTGLGIVRRADGLGHQVLGRALAGVVQMDRRDAARFLDRAGQPREALQVVVGKDAELAREALALGLNMGRAGHGQAKSALGPHGQPMELFIREPPVGVALRVGDRCQHEAVLHGRAMREG